MRYETLRARAWSHRAVLALSLIAVLASSAVAARPEIAAKQEQQLYSLRFTVLAGEEQVVFDVSVIENATNSIAGSARVTTQYGQQATMNAEHNGHTIEVGMYQRRDHPAELVLEVKDGSKRIQHARYTWTADADAELPGAPLSLNLKDAKLTDVLRVFGEMTGYAVDIAPGIEGTVTINVTDVPWDQVLGRIARQNGLTVRIVNKTIHVTK